MYDTTNHSFYYRKPESPCKGCGNRFVGCHGTCENYAAWVKVEKEIGDKIKAAKDKENLNNSFAVNGFIKRKKGFLK